MGCLPTYKGKRYNSIDEIYNAHAEPTQRDIAQTSAKLEKENAKLADSIFEAEKAVLEKVKADPNYRNKPEYLREKSVIADSKIKIRENNKLLDGMKILSKDTSIPQSKVQEPIQEATNKVVEKQKPVREEVIAEDKISVEENTTESSTETALSKQPSEAEQVLIDLIAENEALLENSTDTSANPAIQKQIDSFKEKLSSLQEKSKSASVSKDETTVQKDGKSGTNQEEVVQKDTDSVQKEEPRVEAEAIPQEKSAAADREKGYREIEGKRIDRPRPIADGILEHENITAFPTKGEANKIYVATDTKKKYRWFDEKYIEVSNSETAKIVGKKKNVTFGRNAKTGKLIKIEAEYTVVEMDDVQASHYGGSKNQKFFIDEAQPRDRAKDHYKEQDQLRGSNLDPEELGISSNAYFGAPVVNERGEVIQGNGRAAAMRWYHKNKNSKEYKEWLKKEAEELGIDPAELAKMKNPVLVRMVKATDAEAINLGNMTAKNLEDVSREGEAESAALKTIAEKDKITLANIILENSDNEGTVKEVVREAGMKALKYMVDIGMLRTEERAQMISNSGVINSKGVDYLEKIIKAMFFQGTSNADFTAMDNVHGNIRQGVERAIVGLLSTEDSKALNKEIANIVAVLADYFSFKRKYPNTSFDNWMSQIDMYGKTPADRMTESEQAIASYMATGDGGDVPTQKQIAAKLQQYVKEVGMQEETLFSPADKGLSKEEAVKKVFPKKKPRTQGGTTTEQYSTRPVRKTKEDVKDAKEQLGTEDQYADSRIQRDRDIKLSTVPRAEIEAYKSKNRGLVPFRRDVIKGLRKSLGFFFEGMKFVPRVIYAKSRRAGVLGSISGSNMQVKITNYADVPTIIHELGHWLDMAYGITKNAKAKLDQELSNFWDVGGASFPPGTSDRAMAGKVYKDQNYPNKSIPDTISALTTEIETATAESADLKNQLAKLDPKQAQNKAAIDDLRTKRTEVNKQIQELSSARAGLKELVGIEAKAKESLKKQGIANPSEKQISDEIENLQQDYRRMEGLAEFVYAWTINPQAAINAAPKTYEAMKAAVLAGKNGAKKWAELEKSSYDIRLWMSLNVEEMAQSTRQETSVEFNRRPFLEKQAISLENFLDKYGIKSVNGTPSMSWWDQIQAFWTNDKKAIKTSMNKLFKMQGINMDEVMKGDVDQNFYVLTNLMSGQNDKAREFIEKSGMKRIVINAEGTLGYETILDNGEAMTVSWLLEPLSDHPNFTDQNFDERVNQINDDKELAALVMKAERTLELAQRFDREGNISALSTDQDKMTDVEAANKILADFQNYPEPLKKRITEFNRRYRAMADATLQYAKDSGLLSEEKYAEIKAANMSYVGLQRIFDDELGVLNGGKGGSGQKGAPIKEIKGSARDTGDVVENLINSFYGTLNRADKNYVNGRFVSLLRGDEFGLDPMPLSEFGKKVDGPGEGVMEYWNNGTAEYWKLDPDIALAFGVLRDLSSYNANATVTLDRALKAIEWTIGLGPRAIQWTTTRFPAFAKVINPIRDYGQRKVQSRTARMPFASKIESAAKKIGVNKDLLEKMGMKPHDFDLTDEKARELFFTYGGGQSGHDIYLNGERQYHKALYYAIRELARKGSMLPSTDNFVGRYEDWLQKGEMSNRIAEFKQAYVHFKKQGMTDYAAAKRAAFEARDLCDFAIQGKVMKYLKHSAPFLNANVQGMKRYLKFMKEMSVDGWQQKDPTLFTRFLMFSALPSAAMTVMANAFGYEDEYAELPNYQRDMFYNIKLYPTQIGFIPIPKPFEIGLTGSFFERLMDATVFGKPTDKAFKGFGSQMVQGMVPIKPWEPINYTGTLKPILELQSNYNSFRDETLIYDKQKILKERTGRLYASNLGQWLGTNVGHWFGENYEDPRAMDHLVSSWFSYFGNHAIKLSNLLGERITKEEVEELEKEKEDPKTSTARYNEIAQILKTTAPAKPSQMYSGWTLEGILQEAKLYRHTDAQNLKVVSDVLKDVRKYQIDHQEDPLQLEGMLELARSGQGDQRQNIKNIVEKANTMHERYEKSKELYDKWLEGNLKEYNGESMEGLTNSQAKNILFVE